MTDSWEYVSEAPPRTVELGRVLGEQARGGDVLALCGPLGAGKTQLVKGLASGLGVTRDEPVVSPTFVLVREYAGRLRLLHLDAYRLSGPAELLALGFEEMIEDRSAMVAVEWANRVRPAVPPDACWIELEHVDPQTRRIRVRWADAERLAAVAARL